jgi:large subunit ribosomal protein L22
MMEERKESRAFVKMVRITPRKMRLTADLIRGKDVESAFKILKFTPRKAARILKKLLKSAVANAENNHGMDVDRLYVDSIQVGQGPTWKRILSRSMGRANPILKRTSHTTVILRELDEKVKRAVEPAGETDDKTGKSTKPATKSVKKPVIKKPAAKKPAPKKPETRKEPKAAAKKSTKSPRKEATSGTES